MEGPVITEEMNIYKDWYLEARTQTLKTLPEFLRKLSEEFKHDYGTICHAIAASAIAASCAMDRTRQGGITGFQSREVMWQFIRNWSFYGQDIALRLINFEQMLFPQYEHYFQKKMSQDTWNWLQAKAKEMLSNGPLTMDKKVREHVESIANGKIPFGFDLEYDEE